MMRVLCFLTVMCAMMVVSNVVATSDLVKKSTHCSPGWTEGLKVKGRCFLYVPKHLTWANAEKNCQAMGAHLASVHSFDEYHEIQKLIADVTLRYDTTWIGGTNAMQKEHWFWSDGSTFRFTNWCPGEPNYRGGNKHCLQMNDGDGKCWDDIQCWKEKPSLCAKN